MVLACYAEVQEFEGLGGLAAVDTGALDWLVLVCDMGGISDLPAHRARYSIPMLQHVFG